VLAAALLVAVLVLISPFRTPKAKAITQHGRVITLNLGSKAIRVYEAVIREPFNYGAA